MTTDGLILPATHDDLLWTPQSVPVLETREAPVDDEDAKELALPKPTGWKILCAVPKLPERYANSSIVRPDAFARQDEIATTVLFVMDVGPLAYKDKAKFGCPDGGTVKPWCKKGDFVLVRTYAGTRFKVFDNEFRLLNDDQIDAVVADPRGIARV